MIGVLESPLEAEIEACKHPKEASSLKPLWLKPLDCGDYKSGSRSERTSAKLLILEGNIGVGKTTLARKLACELNYKLYLEPTVENPFLGEESFVK